MSQVSHQIHPPQPGLCDTLGQQAASAHLRAQAVCIPGRKGGVTSSAEMHTRRNRGTLLTCSQMHVPVLLATCMPPPHLTPGLLMPGTDVKLISPGVCCFDLGEPEPGRHLP